VFAADEIFVLKLIWATAWLHQYNEKNYYGDCQCGATKNGVKVTGSLAGSLNVEMQIALSNKVEYDLADVG
jgi:hypothetical protein